MSANGRNASVPTALGLRAQRGGAVTVGVTLENDEPGVVLSCFLATAAPNDRISLEPYHVAFDLARAADGGASAEAEAAVAEGRKRQNALAAKGLAEIVHTLRSGQLEPVIAALLVNRAGWVTDLLSYSLAYPDHPPVAEGLAVRDALRFALGRCAVDVDEVDEKSLPRRASEVLALPSPAIDARLKALGAEAGRPWRKEQKLACLAAWASLVSAR